MRAVLRIEFETGPWENLVVDAIICQVATKVEIGRRRRRRRMGEYEETWGDSEEGINMAGALHLIL